MSRREPYEMNAPEDGAKVFWKSLEDKQNPTAAQTRAESEFPLGLEEAKAASIAAAKSDLVKLRKSKDAPKDVSDVSVGRRGFMFFAGASAALLAEGCARRPVEKILPYSKAPEHVIPGVAAYYASVIPQRGDAIGVLVESHEGRPTKIEGNPAHPSSLGATDAWTQASLYDLYDPDRGTTPMKGARQGTGGFGNHAPATWGDFDQAFTDLLRTAQADGGGYTVRVVDRAPIEAGLGLAALGPDELAQRLAEDPLLLAPALAAAGDAGGGPGAPGDLVEGPAVVVRSELVDRPSALLAEVVGQLVGGDGEQVRLDVALLVVVRQAGEEADEGLLHDVLAGRAVAAPAVHARQQPALEPLDELPPGRGVARADLSDQQGVGIGRRHRWIGPARIRPGSVPRLDAGPTGILTPPPAPWPRKPAKEGPGVAREAVDQASQR